MTSLRFEVFGYSHSLSFGYLIVLYSFLPSNFPQNQQSAVMRDDIFKYLMTRKGKEMKAISRQFEAELDCSPSKDIRYQIGCLTKSTTNLLALNYSVQLSAIKVTNCTKCMKVCWLFFETSTKYVF